MKSLIPVLTFVLVSAQAFAGAVRVEYRGAQRVLTITRTVQHADLDATMDYIYDTIATHIDSKKLKPTGPAFSRTFGETKSHITIQAGYPVAANFPGGSVGEIQSTYLSGGRHLSTLHVGSYATIDLAYIDIDNFMWTYGYRSIGTPVEFYLEPTAKGIPRTLVVWPVSKIAGE